MSHPEKSKNAQVKFAGGNFLDEEISIVSTPRPLSCSTERKGRKIEIPVEIKHNDSQESLGILSIHSEDLHFNEPERLEFQRRKAAECLERASRLSSVSIPSRLLRPSEITASHNTVGVFNISDSTISESDLLNEPTEASTPRSSLAPERLSLTLARFASSLKDPNLNSEDIIEGFRKSVGSDFFGTSTDIEAKLNADEASWMRQNAVPITAEDFSVAQLDAETMKMSMGEFFQGRSDDLTKILCRSPKKTSAPIPIIAESEADSFRVENVFSDGGKNSSIGLSTIAQVLSDTKQTTSRALDYFFKECQPSFASSAGPHIISCQAEKENVNTTNFQDSIDVTATSAEKTASTFQVLSHKDKSVASSRSSSSLSNLPEGKLPIDTTKTEIVWGCVKLGKFETQNFVIRNKSSGKVKLKCCVSKPFFKFLKDAEMMDSLKLALYPNETRSISICFLPTTLGAVKDQINFMPLDQHLHQTKAQFIMLFGYGGYGNVTLHDVARDTAGRNWLSLGVIDEVMSKSFVVRNSGNLPSFALFSFQSKAMYSFKTFEIEPERLTLQPGEQREVTLRYTPKRDLNFLNKCGNSSVLDIGVLKVVSGTEVDRGRIRRLCRKAREKRLDVEELAEIVSGPLSKESIPSDLHLLTESLGSMKRLLQQLSHQEVIMMVEQDPDRTLTCQMIEETSDFQTLLQDTTVPIFESTTNILSSVEPSELILISGVKNKDVLFLRSSSSKVVPFKISSPPGDLRVRPAEGLINPGNCAVVQVEWVGGHVIKLFKIGVQVENELLEVKVKIVKL